MFGFELQELFGVIIAATEKTDNPLVWSKVFVAIDLKVRVSDERTLPLKCHVKRLFQSVPMASLVLVFSLLIGAVTSQLILVESSNVTLLDMQVQLLLLEPDVIRLKLA